MSDPYGIIDIKSTNQSNIDLNVSNEENNIADEQSLLGCQETSDSNLN